LTEISQAVYKHPVVANDLARWNATLLMPSPLPQYNLIGVGDVPAALGDFKGKRLRGPGGIAGVMKQLGAVKTGVAANEVRQALDSGVIDTVAFAQHAHLAFGSVQSGKWATTNLNLGTANCPVVVNTDALAGLKPAHKEALMGSVAEALDHYVANYEGSVISVRAGWVKKYAGKFDAQALFDFTAAEFAK